MQDQNELDRGKSLGIASLILGIIALLCALGGMAPFIGFVAAIIGFILGRKARQILPPGENGLATAGWICSIIAICLGSLVIIFFGGLLGLIGLGAFWG